MHAHVGMMLELHGDKPIPEYDNDVSFSRNRTSLNISGDGKRPRGELANWL
jgi:hypothetical protein